MMTLHGLQDGEALRVRVALSGCLTIDGRRFWSLDSERFGGRWVSASALPNDDQVAVFWLAHDGPRYRADLLPDHGFFDHAAALAVLEGTRAQNPALLNSRTATSEAVPLGTRWRLRQRLRTHLGLLIRETARAIDVMLTPGRPSQIVRSMMHIEASHDDAADQVPLPELVPLRLRSAREAAHPGCDGCPWRSGAARLPRSPRSSGEAPLDLPAQGDRSSEGLPEKPSARNHASTSGETPVARKQPAAPGGESQPISDASKYGNEA